MINLLCDSYIFVVIRISNTTFATRAFPTAAVTTLATATTTGATAKVATATAFPVTITTSELDSTVYNAFVFSWAHQKNKQGFCRAYDQQSTQPWLYC